VQAAVVQRFAEHQPDGLVDVPSPQVRPTEVLIEVRAVPVNYVDVVTCTGRYQFSPELPYTPGKGPSGVVRAVGSEVDLVAVGDRVLAMAERGGYAELAVADQQQVYRLPAVVSFEQAAAVAVAFDTAWMSLRERARLAPGDSVLVLGATGAVGGAAVQLARAMGAGLILAGVSGPERADELKTLGADALVHLSMDEPPEAIRAQVRELTGGRGVDVVLDPLGGDAFDGAVRSLAWGGRLVVVGFATGRIATLKTNYLLLKNIEVSGIQISDYRKRAPDLVRTCMTEIFDFLERGVVQAPAIEVMPLENWGQALRKVAARKAERRVVLVPAPVGGDVAGRPCLH
jgi:NADPH2:quinone reductase